MPTPPDLAFSNAGNINDSWTVQQLVVSPGNVNAGYDTKAPTEEPKEDKVEDNGE